MAGVWEYVVSVVPPVCRVVDTPGSEHIAVVTGAALRNNDRFGIDPEEHTKRCSVIGSDITTGAGETREQERGREKLLVGAILGHACRRNVPDAGCLGAVGSEEPRVLAPLHPHFVVGLQDGAHGVELLPSRLAWWRLEVQVEAHSDIEAEDERDDIGAGAC
jgi:hypothetical protein